MNDLSSTNSLPDGFGNVSIDEGAAVVAKDQVGQQIAALGADAQILTDQGRLAAVSRLSDIVSLGQEVQQSVEQELASRTQEDESGQLNKQTTYA